MAKFYIDSVSKIIAEGIYRSYVTQIEQVSGVKGRLLLTQNIRSSHITKEKLTEKKIIEWAKEHFEKNKAWPNEKSGKIFSLDEDCASVNQA